MPVESEPTLAVLEAVTRRYGILVKWVLAAAIAGAVWVTAMTFRVSALEKAVEKLDPMKESLTRIETRLGIKEPGK